MKVLHVSTFDSKFGAARAAHRIHSALLSQGVESRMRVLEKGTNDATVTGGNGRSLIGKAIEEASRRSHAWLRRKWTTNNHSFHSFGHASAGILEELNASDADVINLHWITNLLSIRDIARLTKPVVWTLHDMWPFCGAEHYAPDTPQARFRVGYNRDNRPVGESGNDYERLVWEAKRKMWRDRRWTIVGDSRWLAACARDSMLFQSMDIHSINYPIECRHTWTPTPKMVARQALRLPPNVKLVLMGSEGGVADPRKGGDLLRTSLGISEKLTQDHFELVVFGGNRPPIADEWPCPVHWLGFVQDDRVLNLAYSAADVMVVPSRQEAFGQTALEALSCGTPVVAFNVGGLPDVVDHRLTGWLAQPFDPEDLAAGIVWILADDIRARALSAAALEVVERRFSEPVVAGQYRDVYQSAIARYADRRK